MNEPKKRGRPSKADVAARQEPVVAHPNAEQIAQAYALKVWAGQSPDTESRTWRIERVKEALAGQGLSFEGVTLPQR